jgi:hypothetical protein
MDLQDYQEERKKVELKFSESEEKIAAASMIYQAQKLAIQDIKGTEGFAEILRYWKSRKEACEEYFRGTDNDLSYNLRLKGRYDEICQFVQFLENLISEVRL